MAVHAAGDDCRDASAEGRDGNKAARPLQSLPAMSRNELWGNEADTWGIDVTHLSPWFFNPSDAAIGALPLAAVCKHFSRALHASHATFWYSVSMHLQRGCPALPSLAGMASGGCHCMALSAPCCSCAPAGRIAAVHPGQLWAPGGAGTLDIGNRISSNQPTTNPQSRHQQCSIAKHRARLRAIVSARQSHSAQASPMSLRHRTAIFL